MCVFGYFVVVIVASVYLLHTHIYVSCTLLLLVVLAFLGFFWKLIFFFIRCFSYTNVGPHTPYNIHDDIRDANVHFRECLIILYVCYKRYMGGVYKNKKKRSNNWITINIRYNTQVRVLYFMVNERFTYVCSVYYYYTQGKNEGWFFFFGIPVDGIRIVSAARKFGQFSIFFRFFWGTKICRTTWIWLIFFFLVFDTDLFKLRVRCIRIYVRVYLCIVIRLELYNVNDLGVCKVAFYFYRISLFFVRLKKYNNIWNLKSSPSEFHNAKHFTIKICNHDRLYLQQVISMVSAVRWEF